MSWEHYNPVKVISKWGGINFLRDYIDFNNPLLITSPGMIKRGVARQLMDGYPLQVNWTVHTVGPNPDIDLLDTLADSLRKTNFDGVVALGGGSVIDSAKTLACILPIPGFRILDKWLRHNKLYSPSLPLRLVCLPSTSGTGAEVTPFATIWDTQEQKKHSLAGDFMFPSTVMLDPELTLSLPWETTLYCALDVISHSLESMWNHKATTVSLALADRSLRLSLSSLPTLEICPQSVDIRDKLQQASFLADLAISQNRTALAHSISYPLTLKFKVPHGLACGFSLASLIKIVTEAEMWPKEVDQHLVVAIRQMLVQLKLPSHIKSCCELNSVMQLTCEMFTLTRSQNFIMEANTESCQKSVN